MAIVQISKIQQRSGNLVDLPQLDEAEFGFATDEKRLFIGKTTDNIENIEVLTQYSYIDFNQINGAVGNLDITASSVADGQVLAYDGNNWVNRGGLAGGLLDLGTVSNVKISGGAIDYVLTTDGTGNLNWTAKSSIVGYIQTATPQILDKNSTNATATDSVTDLITLDDITGYQVNTAVEFSGTAFGSLTPGTTYYVTSVDLGLVAISISTTQGGANLALTTDTGSMVVNIIGTVVTTTADNFFTDGLTATITNAKGMTELDGGSYYLDVLSANTVALYTDPLFAGSVDSTLFTPYAYTTFTQVNASTNYLTLGDTSSFNQYDPVIFIGTLFGNLVANQVYYVASIVSSTQITISTTEDGANLVTFSATVSGSANVYVPGGRIIATIGGSGGVSPAGGTQYSVQYNNTNLLDGDANFTYNFNTKLLTLTGGNANVGNLNTTGVVTTTRLFSNVGTGVAPPFQVLSTDRVGNLNVAYSNVTDFSVVTAQSSGTFYPTFVSTNNTSNKALGVNSLFAFNTTTSTVLTPNLTVNSAINTSTMVATGNISAANANLGNLALANFFNGTFAIEANAQPNITSFGNGTVITANGSINPSANVVYNLGNNTNRWNDLYLSGSTVYLGNAIITSDANGVVITNADGGKFTVGGTSSANTATIVNGNSNVIVSANSNVNISVAGVANVLRVTSSGVNVAGTINATSIINGSVLSAFSAITSSGTLSATGNANVNNLGTSQVLATANVTAPQLISNISTGTAPLVVSSTTVVANLRAATSNVANTINDAAQPNITSVGTLTGLGVNGTITAVNITANTGAFTGNGSGLSQLTGANVTGTVSSATTAGTVTTAAQPNITSTGTLTGLGVNGTITAVNITANTGNFTGSGANLTTLNASNISSGTLAQARLANSSLIVNGQTISLGGTGTITANTTQTLTFGSYLTGTSFNGGTANTIAVDATSANTASKVVARDASGNFSAGTITATLSGAATTAGTVTANAQPNINSVGTLSALTVSGNISAGNVSAIIRPTSGSGTAGIIFPADPGGGAGDLATIKYYAVTGETTVLELAVTNDADDKIYLNATGGTNVAGILQTTAISTGANSIAGTLTGNWTLTSGSRLQATYADLAENYIADSNYEPGTVLMFGGSAELTIAEEDTKKVAGVVSTEPAYVMNSSITGANIVTLALMGRVPVKVKGEILRGDMLVSAGGGYAKAATNPEMGMVIGKALSDFNLGVAVRQLGELINRTSDFTYNGPPDELSSFLALVATRSGEVEGIIEVVVGIG